MRATEAGIERIDVSAYQIPTDAPEADGTYAWDATTLVLVEAYAGGRCGLGFTYADTATATLVKDVLARVVCGRNAMDVPGCWEAMVRSIRNLGRPGIASMAISAVDVALWDLKGRLLDLSLVDLLGAVRDAVPVYGSGGFTSYSIGQLQAQLRSWVGQGIPRVKMKIGTHPADDLGRVRAARRRCAVPRSLAPGPGIGVQARRRRALRRGILIARDVWYASPCVMCPLARRRERSCSAG